jgi:hypothetical protein
LLTVSDMVASWGPLLVALSLGAGVPDAQKKATVRASIVTAVACTATAAGGVVLGIGVARHDARTSIGGSALLGLGLHALALAVMAWLWPADRNRPVQVALVPHARGAGAGVWLTLP